MSSTSDVEQLAHVVALEVAALRESLTEGMGKWANGFKLNGARALQLSRAAVQPNLYNGSGRLLGWSVTVDAAAGGPGLVVFRDGDGGDVLAVLNVAPGTAETRQLGAGVNVGQALVAQVTGAVTGAVYFQG